MAQDGHFHTRTEHIKRYLFGKKVGLFIWVWYTILLPKSIGGSLAMKKILIIGLLIIILVIGAVFGYAITNAGKLARQFKPALEKAASQALQSKVTLGNLDVAVFPEAKIIVDKFNIVRAKSKSEGLNLNNLTLHIELLQLLSGTLSISKLSLDKPEITVIKSAEGIYLEGLPKSAKKPAPQKTPPAKDKQPAKSAELPEGLSLELKEFALSAASILFKEQTSNQEYRLSPINIDSSISLKGNLVNLEQFVASVGLLGKANLEIKTSESDFDVKTSTLKLGKLAINLAGGLDLADFGAPIKPCQITDLQGVFNVLASKEKQTLNASELSFKLNGRPISLAWSVVNDAHKLKLDSLKLRAFSGELTAFTDLATTGLQPFSTKLEISGINVAEVLTTLNPGSKAIIKGTLEKTSVNLAGSLGSGTNLLKSLTGQIELLLKDGALEGTNIGGQTLRNLKDLPFLKESLWNQIPKEFQGDLQGKSTVIKSLSGSFDLRSAVLNTKKLLLESTLFDLTGSGNIHLQPQVKIDLGSDIIFSRVFSLALVAKVKDLEYGLNADKRLVLPLAISGTPPTLTVVPDAKKLIKATAKKAAAKEAGKLLNRFMGSSDKKGKGTKEGIGGMLGF